MNTCCYAVRQAVLFRISRTLVILYLILGGCQMLKKISEEKVGVNTGKSCLVIGCIPIKDSS